MLNIPDNIKQLGRFVCYAILAFATVEGLHRLFTVTFPYYEVFNLLLCANLWYLAYKEHKDSQK